MGVGGGGVGGWGGGGLGWWGGGGVGVGGVYWALAGGARGEGRGRGVMLSPEGGGLCSHRRGGIVFVRVAVTWPFVSDSSDDIHHVADWLAANRDQRLETRYARW